MRMPACLNVCLHALECRGVVYASGGYAHLERCEIKDANASEGGAMHIAGGETIVLDSYIRNSRARNGAVMFIKSGDIAVIDSYINDSLATHTGAVAYILAGDVLLLRTKAQSSRSGTDQGAVFSQSGGKLRLMSSNISSPVLNGSWVKEGTGKAFECQQSQLRAPVGSKATLFDDTATNVMFVLCEVQNLPLGNPLRPIVARNSHFNPALDARMQPWQDCAAAKCDHRINCSTALTGGVECYCENAGLEFSGAVDTGGNCIHIEPTSTQFYTQATELDVVIRKPLLSITQTLVLSSRGDTTVHVSFAFKEYDGNFNLLLQDQFISSRANVSRRLGSNGLFVIWGASNTSEELINPTGEILHPAGGQIRKVRSFALSFDCSLRKGLAAPNMSHCAKDGDVAHTVLSMYTKDMTGQLRSTHNISITAHVEALPSCQFVLSHATVSPDVASLDHLSPDGLTIFIHAIDVDDQPILHSSPQLEVLWGVQDKTTAIPHTREEKNVLKSLISMRHFSRPGTYELKVRLKSGWDSALRQATICTVLRRTVEVLSKISTIFCTCRTYLVGALLRWVLARLKHGGVY